MTSEEIKKECELMYQKIEDAKIRLKEIRTICKHENAFEGNYSWRIGSILPAIICDDCGELVRWIGIPILNIENP